MSDELLHSPLHDRHVAAGAKLAEFGGWEMPLEYAGGGVLAEHHAASTAHRTMPSVWNRIASRPHSVNPAMSSHSAAPAAMARSRLKRGPNECQ